MLCAWDIFGLHFVFINGYELGVVFKGTNLFYPYRV